MKTQRGGTLHRSFYVSQGNRNPPCRARMGTNPGQAGSNLRPNIGRAAEQGSEQRAGLHLAGAGLKAHYGQLLPAWHLPPSAHVLSPVREGHAAHEAVTLLLRQPPLPMPSMLSQTAFI